MHASEYLPLFLAECREDLHELNLAVIRLEDHPEDRETIDAIFRVAHSLKGMAATMGFERMASLTHAMEDVFEVLRERGGRVDKRAVDCMLDCLDALADAVDGLDADGVERLEAGPLIARLRGLVRLSDRLAPPVAARPQEAAARGESSSSSTGADVIPTSVPALAAPVTVRVESDRLDQLEHAVDELAERGARVDSLGADAGAAGLPEALRELAESVDALQSLVTQIRLIPAEIVFMRIPRLVRDLSARLGTRVELSLAGQDTELDRSVLQPLGDLIAHLVRNSLAHGLESPEERTDAGKPETGKLEVSVRRSGDGILVAVRDDGRGFDPARVARSASERGLIGPRDVAHVDMRHAIELAFAPGVTTAERTTDVSGRGVGLDAVVSLTRTLAGSVDVSSEPGVGTVIEVKLPRTGAVVQGLLVEARRRAVVVPLERVERSVRLADHVVRELNGRRVVLLRDGAIPLVDLAEELGLGKGSELIDAVVLHGSAGRIAIGVESVVGKRRLVSRPLPAEHAAGAAVSGGAVLPTGAPALVLDCDALCARTHARSDRSSTAA